MDEVERKIPGWKEMASIREGVTFVHTVRAFLALGTSEVYQNASDVDQRNMEWAVLLHDLAKMPIDPKTGEKIRDATHPFRSAVLAAKILPSHGFYTTDQYNDRYNSWAEYTDKAITTDEKGREINYNKNLPKIIKGIEEMFGQHSSTSIIVKSILFHQSLNLLEEWPDATPLTDSELKQYMDNDLLNVLVPLATADSDSWQLFNPEQKVYFGKQINNRVSFVRSHISE